ncbi:MAG: DUF2480 family protein [Chitinophagales bacterium]
MMEIKNKIAESGLITIDLEDYFPKEAIIAFDIKPLLFKELILKEKDFRLALKTQNWVEFSDKTIAIFCSSDAILPQWSFMLITQYLLPFTNKIYYGNPKIVAQNLLLENINKINIESFTNQKVVIKGCSQETLSSAAYIEISKKLMPYVASLFFGEPCSTVPVYKKKK